MENFQNFSAMRSVNEPMAQVVNSSNASVEAKKTRKRTRNHFSVAKAKTIALYQKVEWLEDSFKAKTSNANGTTDQALKAIKRDELFYMCLKKTLNDMTGYNVEAFKKDLAIQMATLLFDRRFEKTCENAKWSMFQTAQMLAWANASDFKKIRDLGLSQVSGVNTPCKLAFSFDDLKNDLFALGLDEGFFKNDRFVKSQDATDKDAESNQ